MTAPTKLLLGLTGGIACYKAAELVRLLTGSGVDVQVVMTEAACRFVAPLTLQALSAKPVFTDMWDSRIANGMPHIDLSRDRDAIVIAPASANFIAKLVCGLADDLLSTLCLARECPLLVAPAMNRQMWENVATQRNIAQLKNDGVVMLGPAAGDQACGETGMGRLLEPYELLEEIEAFFQPKVLSGTRVLITAGPTFEPIDAVRGITNLSSGKMGYAVARAALDAGAEVTLISGPTSLVAPVNASLVKVVSANDMLEAVNKHADGCDVFVSVAAVADYRVSNASPQKIKKENQHKLTLELVPNPDILAAVASRPNAPFCVGFAAESENLNEYAEAKRRRKKLPLLVGNRVQDTLGQDEAETILLDDSGKHALPKAAKRVQARRLVEHIARMLNAADAADRS
jgi:phosphopantothenoylcysteine decarboxylase/phosphopantothenate--cysteine ligase